MNMYSRCVVLLLLLLLVFASIPGRITVTGHAKKKVLLMGGLKRIDTSLTAWTSQADLSQNSVFILGAENMTFGLKCYFTIPGHGVEMRECSGSCIIVWVQRETLRSFCGCSKTVKPTDCHQGKEKIENFCYCNEDFCNKPL